MASADSVHNRPLRLALAQVNPCVGDLAGNANMVVEWSQRAAAAGADVVAFPEMMLTGYPIEDLALRESFQRASVSGIHALAAELAQAGLAELAVIAGFLDADTESAPGVPGKPRGGPHNAAAVIFGGEVVATYHKHHLPNYGVFDEYRYFVPGAEPLIVHVNGVDVALAICEDLWQDGGPVSVVRELGADLLLVLNGSPYERSKDDVRLALCRRRAQEADATLAYVNLVGGQDELVFDGDSMVVDPAGELLARAPEFVEDLLLADIPLRTPRTAHSHAEAYLTTSDSGRLNERASLSAPSLIAPELLEAEEVYRALTLGLRDYVRKNGFTSVALGLSGGIDSALVAALACDAIGAEHVLGVSMPSQYSSQHSRDDAADSAARTGLRFRTVEIAPLVAAFHESYQMQGLAAENLQARIRGVLLMALSNSEGPLVLATGNKSEIAVGYSTIYGDAVGGFAPIKDVPKSLVWQLSRWRNEHAEALGQTPPIPENSISKPPSAELRPDQLDSDSLPDYALLDNILDAYVEHDRGAEQLLADGFDQDVVERVVRLIDFAEYKRRQYPPGTKITFKAFGRDRRLPITNRWREHS